MRRPTCPRHSSVAMRPFLLSITCSVLLFTAAIGNAQDQAKAGPSATQKDEARRRFFEAMRASDAGDFEKARLAYVQTYALIQTPEVLRNLAIAEVRTNHLAEGARHLSAYLHGEPAKTETADQHRFARELLTTTEKKIGRLDVEVDTPGADVNVDAEPIGQSPLSLGWYVEPGEHAVSAQLGTLKAGKHVDATAGETLRVALALQDASATDPARGGAQSKPAAPVAKDRPVPSGASMRAVERPNWPLFLTGGVALAGLSTGIVGALMASSNKSGLDGIAGSDTSCGTGTPHVTECSRVSQLVDQYDRNVKISRVGWAVLGASGVAGVMYLAWPVSTSRASGRAVSLALGAQQIEVTGQF